MTPAQIVREALLGLAELNAIEAEMLAAEEAVDAAFDEGGILADCVITLNVGTAHRECLSECLVTTDETANVAEIETFGVPVGADPSEETESVAA